MRKPFAVGDRVLMASAFATVPCGSTGTVTKVFRASPGSWIVRVHWDDGTLREHTEYDLNRLPKE